MNSDLIEITWTFVFGFALPGMVLTACPIAMTRFGQWVNTRATAEGCATEWTVKHHVVAKREANLPDLRTTTERTFS